VHGAEQDLRSGPGRTWQNLVDFGGIWQNAADCRQIAVDCRQIAIGLPSRGQSLLAASVETGGRV